MMRIGYGVDFHVFAMDRKLILGGVEIKYDRGLLGHSDADILTHAICDALLGAAGLGDIGLHFPDTNKKYKGVSSLVLLEECLRLISDQYEISNIDCVLIVEEPKLELYKNEIRASLASVLKLTPEQINIKATTSEGMGPAGRKEGMEARAVVLLNGR